MDRSAISSILQELNLHEHSVANIYNYGSWVYGTNSPTSDRDLMIVTRSNKDPLKFHDDIQYFYSLTIIKLGNQYDVCVHSVENFEVLLEKNYLLAIECIFLPDEFKIKEEIDFRSIYLEKYYNTLRLKLVGFYENFIAIKMFDLDDKSIYHERSSRSSETDQSNQDYLFKNLFHGFRHLDIVEQLIQTKSIHDFKRVSHVLNEMKAIRGDSSDNSNMQPVLNFIVHKSAEYKSKLDALVSTNIVIGTFEAHITFDCTHDTEKYIEKLKKTCENTKYKIIFINLNTDNKNDKPQELMTSSYHYGEYPSIVKQIQEEAYKHFKDFNVIRIKIQTLASNEGVPKTDTEKRLFWDDDPWNAESTYFEFHYKVLVKNDTNKENLNELQNLCQRYSQFKLHLSHNAFQQVDEKHFHYIVTMSSFNNDQENASETNDEENALETNDQENASETSDEENALETNEQENAFKRNDQVVQILTDNNFPPLKVVRAFVVDDSHFALDQ